MYFVVLRLYACIARLICIQGFSYQVAVSFGSCPGSRALPSIGRTHDINHYPHYHDALYHPQCHSATFKSPANICTWLKISLASHPQFCLMWRYAIFVGVSYDGVCITIWNQKVSISIALNEIVDTNYPHRVVFFASFPPAKFSLSKSVRLRS